MSQRPIALRMVNDVLVASHPRYQNRTRQCKKSLRVDPGNVQKSTDEQDQGQRRCLFDAQGMQLEFADPKKIGRCQCDIFGPKTILKIQPQCVQKH